MTRITRYIAVQVGMVTVIATGLLCLLVALIQSVKFIDLIVNNGLPISDFAIMFMLATPRSLVYLIPVVMLFRVGDFSAMIAVA